MQTKLGSGDSLFVHYLRVNRPLVHCQKKKELLRDFWCCRHRPVQHATFSHIFLPFKTRENNRKNTRKLMTRSCPTLNSEVPPGFDLSSLNYKYPLQLTETVGRHFRGHHLRMTAIFGPFFTPPPSERKITSLLLHTMTSLLLILTAIPPQGCVHP